MDYKYLYETNQVTKKLLSEDNGKVLWVSKYEYGMNRSKDAIHERCSWLGLLVFDIHFNSI